MQPSALSPEFIRVLAAISKLVILALLLERALVMLFEYRYYQKYLGQKGLKAPIAYLLSLVVCGYFDFDILSILFEPGTTTTMGILITAAVVAGGSAGAITLFQGVLGLTKGTQAKMKEAKMAQAEAAMAEARARKRRAEAEASAAVAEAKARKSQAERGT